MLKAIELASLRDFVSRSWSFIFSQTGRQSDHYIISIIKYSNYPNLTLENNSRVCVNEAFCSFDLNKQSLFCLRCTV